MDGSEHQPSPGAVAEVRRLAGASATIASITRLAGGQHADTWRVDTEHPATSVIVRRFPEGDEAGRREERILAMLDGFGGLAPVLLGADLDGSWSAYPTTVISRLDGSADITPSEPLRWAGELGRALAGVHAVPAERLGGLPSVVDGPGSRDRLDGPLAPVGRRRWAEIVASPAVLTHGDYWSGNVVWRDGGVAGVVDWSGAARGPRGYDVGWCRLDLVLLYDEAVADVFLAAYEDATGAPVGDLTLWDVWAAARSYVDVVTWGPNYAPLGRPDLDATELRSRHARWSAILAERTAITHLD